MNEIVKTLGIAVVAVVCAAFAFVVNQERPTEEPGSAKGTMLVELDDALKIKRLAITEYDENRGSGKTFEVRQIGGVWSLTSHSDYPADAEDHLRDAATALMQREVLDVVSDNPGTHADFGVLDPQGSHGVGAEGVGKRVELFNAEDDLVADLIVGAEVQDRSEQRYVRLADRDQVYVVQLDPSELSTKFEDWIEEDLLKLNTFDIREVVLNDYSVESRFTLQGGIVPAQLIRSKIDATYNDADSKWELRTLQDYQVEEGAEEGELVTVELTDQEQLSQQALNDMKSALDDLKIVNVDRKPEGLNDLQDIAKSRETIQSLASRGFMPHLIEDPETGKQSIGILSADGEAIVRMKNGVEYVLRFGSIAGTGTTEAEGANGEAEKKADVHRYLFVMAQFNGAMLEKPELETLPEAPAAGEASEDDASEGEAAEGEAGADADASAHEQEVERITKENQRKQEEYDGKVEAGKKNVDELNERFADWYYVIADEVYQKIHLGRADVVEEKKAEEAAINVTPGGPLGVGGPGGAVGELEDLRDELEEEE